MTPSPLMALVQEWDEQGDGFGNYEWKSTKHECAKELRAALKAWAEQLPHLDEDADWIIERVLGVEEK